MNIPYNQILELGMLMKDHMMGYLLRWHIIAHFMLQYIIQMQYFTTSNEQICWQKYSFGNINQQCLLYIVFINLMYAYFSNEFQIKTELVVGTLPYVIVLPLKSPYQKGVYFFFILPDERNVSQKTIMDSSFLIELYNIHK